MKQGVLIDESELEVSQLYISYFEELCEIVQIIFKDMPDVDYRYYLTLDPDITPMIEREIGDKMRAFNGEYATIKLFIEKYKSSGRSWSPSQMRTYIARKEFFERLIRDCVVLFKQRSTHYQNDPNENLNEAGHQLKQNLFEASQRIIRLKNLEVKLTSILLRYRKNVSHLSAFYDYVAEKEGWDLSP